VHALVRAHRGPGLVHGDGHAGVLEDLHEDDGRAMHPKAIVVPAQSSSAA
jgi:hypothetical protein